MDSAKISQELKKWFFLNRRLLPWRENPSPYEVWVSEVMLQQTQVSVVIAYFKRWMNAFPTIKALSEAPLEKVIKVWEGLGYYSRARNLHQGARYLMEHQGGELPASYDELQKVKGLGPYTIGAILSFAFKQKVPAVDGNVLRVLARYYCIEEEIDKGPTKRKIESLTQEILPEDEPWIVMEALIELGALVCKKIPQCTLCPLKASCLAFQKCKAELLPYKSKGPKTLHLHRLVAVIDTGGEVLVRKGAAGKVMADLWEFPYFERGVNVEEALGIPLEPIEKFPEVTHGFTRYKAYLYPHLYKAKKEELPSYEWVSYKELSLRPFSAGHRKILHHFKALRRCSFSSSHGKILLN